MTTKFKTFRLALLTCATMALFSGAAHAAQTYGNLGGPGVYFGSGNVDGNFAIGTSNGIQLGLRAKNRQTGALIDGSTGTYQTDPGLYLGGNTKAKWNYEFSVNTGSNPIGNYTFSLGVDHDPSAGLSYTFVNPKTYWLDNATIANGFQNSENVGFGNTPGGAFNVNQQGLYTFTLQAFNDGVLVDFVTTNVRVGAPAPVPEPETYALMLAGLVGLAATRRRKQTT